MGTLVGRVCGSRRPEATAVEPWSCLVAGGFNRAPDGVWPKGKATAFGAVECGFESYRPNVVDVDGRR